MTETALAKRTQELASQIQGEKMIYELQKVTGDQTRAERHARMAVTYLKQHPELMGCEPASIYKAVVESAELNLVPNGVLGEAYFVKYGKQCVMIPGYKGLKELAIRSGKAKSFTAEVVREGDQFEYEQGTTPFLRFKKGLGNRGRRIAVFAIAHLTNGQAEFRVLTPEDIAAAKERSQAAKAGSGPWKTDEDAMWEKTAIRRLASRICLTTEFNEQAARADYYENVPAPDRKISASTQGFGFAQPTDDEAGAPQEPEQVEVEVSEPEGQAEAPASAQSDKAEDPIAKMLAAYGKHRVTSVQILSYLGKADLNDITEEDLKQLRGIYESVKRGELSFTDVFGPAETEAKGW